MGDSDRRTADAQSRWLRSDVELDRIAEGILHRRDEQPLTAAKDEIALVARPVCQPGSIVRNSAIPSMSTLWQATLSSAIPA